ncbi:MAG: NnrS family protein [Halomonas sp.]|nr:NnrS family protein [Halomonas sp.]
MLATDCLARTMPLWRLAFRPFFLLGAAFSLLAMLVWGAFWHGQSLLQPHGGMLWWHQHEMMFGFTVAVVVGFLLTAVQNWTGQAGLRGAPLLALAGVWLLGRGLIAFPQGLPPLALAVLDAAFLPLAAGVLAWPVIKVKQWRNLIFVPVLGVLALANALTHAALIAGDPLLLRGAMYLAVLLVALLMTVLGGRVIPFFTSRRLQRPQASRPLWLERCAVGGVMALALLQLASLAGLAVPATVWAGVALIAAVANTIRLLRWEGWLSWRDPLLWGLHVSYAFVCLGLLMWGLAALGWVSSSLAIHALTVGGMGTMMLAMMARVALGHTGRPIAAPRGIGIALGLMVVAAVLRALMPALWPQVTHLTLSFAVLAWSLAYALYLSLYAPVLLRKRVDGQQG